MIYPFLTLDDDTEIVHTEILKLRQKELLRRGKNILAK